jgi:diacylglycerol kinase (ATP)
MTNPVLPSVYLLGNPASGGGKGARLLLRIEEALRARGITPVVRRTERPGHLVELARASAAEGAGLVLVTGGDGSIRDAVAGLLRAGPEAVVGTVVGIIPGGTGNDLARTLGLPRDPDRALEIALDGAERELDVWRWNGEPFINIAGVGLDAAVAAAVNRSFKKLGGTAAYVAAVFSTVPKFKPFQLSLQFPEGEWEGPAWLAAFANARCYGGGMQIAPGADPGDGLLEIVVVGEISRLALLGQVPGLFSGRHVSHPCVRVIRTERVTLKAPGQVVTLDGELLGATPAEITRDPQRIRLRVPR